MSRLDPVHVVFDLDDTLYPARAFAAGGVAAAGAWARERWGVEGVARHMQDLLDAGQLGTLFRATLEQFVPGCPADDVAGFIDVYRRHDPRIELYDDAHQALELTGSLGASGLITDGTDWVQQRKVSVLGLQGRFRKIIYTSGLGGRKFHKSHPKAFQIMQAALGADPARLIYVGDNPGKDFVAPNALGWSTVQILREHTIHDTRAPPAPGGTAHHVLDSLLQIEDLIADLRCA